MCLIQRQMGIDRLPQFLHGWFLYTHFYVKRKVSLKVQYCDMKTALSRMFPPCLITMHITQCEIITEGFLLQLEKCFASWTEARQKYNCECLGDRILHVDTLFKKLFFGPTGSWRTSCNWTFAMTPKRKKSVAIYICSFHTLGATYEI